MGFSEEDSIFFVDDVRNMVFISHCEKANLNYTSKNK